jgi:hypothetical protein
MSQFDTFISLTPCFFKTHSVFSFHLLLGHPNGRFPSAVRPKFCINFSPFPCLLHAPPIASSLFDHSNNIWWRVLIMKLLQNVFFSVLHLLPLKVKLSLALDWAPRYARILNFSTSRPLYLWVKNSVYPYTGGWVGPRAGLDVVKKKSCPIDNRTHIVQPVT